MRARKLGKLLFRFLSHALLVKHNTDFGKFGGQMFGHDVKQEEPGTQLTRPRHGLREGGERILREIGCEQNGANRGGREGNLDPALFPAAPRPCPTSCRTVYGG